MGEHRFVHVYLIFTVVFGRFRSAAGAPGAKVESAGQVEEASISVLGFWYGQYRNWGSSSGTGPRVPVPSMGERYPKAQDADFGFGWTFLG